MRKMMSTVHQKDNKVVQYTKGACEILLERSSRYLNDNNEVVLMTEEIKSHIQEETKKYADKALRVLGACYREYDTIPTNFEPDFLEQDLTFIGFVGMIDPCRKEVYDAIENCRQAGIRPIMITGDHIDTATAIGQDLKIISNRKEAITGSELDGLSDEDLIRVVNDCSVFARVQPEHKTKIVRALKSQNYVVAMTGDGVNDAPALKTANIGCAMGIVGTDVSKEAADVILTDDNFASIVDSYTISSIKQYWRNSSIVFINTNRTVFKQKIWNRYRKNRDIFSNAIIMDKPNNRFASSTCFIN